MLGTSPISPRNTTGPVAPVHFHQSGGAGTAKSATDWTLPATLGSAEPPANRRQRREEQQARSNPPARSVRVKLTREQKVALIKQEMREKNVPLPPPQGQGLTEADQDGWGAWGAETLVKSLQLLRDAVRWMPGPVLGEAASTCDVEGRCEGATTTPTESLAIKDFRKLAAANAFSLTLSPSLQKRSDQTLRGVVLLVADASHYDTTVQGRIASLVNACVVRGDQVLVEAPALNDEQMKEWCWNIDLDARGAHCRGIDVSPARIELDKKHTRYVRAMARLCEAVIGKTVQLDKGARHPSFDELANMHESTLIGYLQQHAVAMNLGDGPSKFEPMERKRIDKLGADSVRAKLEYEEMMQSPENLAEREKTFRDEIDGYATRFPGQTIIAVVGEHHVRSMETWLLQGRDAIVLYPKHN